MFDLNELEREEIKITKKDFDKLIEILKNPPEPNEKLKEVTKEFIEKYRK